MYSVFGERSSRYKTGCQVILIYGHEYGSTYITRRGVRFDYSVLNRFKARVFRGRTGFSVTLLRTIERTRTVAVKVWPKYLQCVGTRCTRLDNAKLRTRSPSSAIIRLKYEFTPLQRSNGILNYLNIYSEILITMFFKLASGKTIL